jgi:hypothetical protein
MIRIAIGFFIVMGAVGYDDMMIAAMEPQPIGPLLLKCVLGMSLVGWGLYDLANRGELDEYR